MDVEVTLRRWGHSLGAVFPQKFVKRLHLKPNQKVTLTVIPKADFRDVFGSLKADMSDQEFKDMVRDVSE